MSNSACCHNRALHTATAFVAVTSIRFLSRVRKITSPQWLCPHGRDAQCGEWLEMLSCKMRIERTFLSSSPPTFSVILCSRLKRSFNTATLHDMLVDRPQVKTLQLLHFEAVLLQKKLKFDQVVLVFEWLFRR